MPKKKINSAITALEAQLKHLEELLDKSISDNEILSNSKIILHKLRDVSRELNELKRLQGSNDD